jgi:hypothetical protein
MRKNNEINIEEFKSESLGNQVAMLRKYLCNKYSVQYMTSYLLIEERDKVMLLDTNADGELDLKNIDKDTIQIKINKNCLQDSKLRSIKARYSIPMTISQSRRILIILEDKKIDRFDSKEREILQDIEDIFDSINVNFE